MASSINPNNIDGAYPVAGQDNDSQGFRDNFTNIKTNFTSAKSEIESLQTTSVTLAAENDFNFTGIISKAVMKNNADSVNALGTVGGAIALDVSTGIIHTATLNASSSISFTNWPTTGRGGRVRFIVTINNVAHTLTLPAAVTLGNETVQGMSSLVITFPATGTYIYDFSTIDAGSVILVEDLTQSDTALGNIQITGNTISAINTNGDIVLSPNGTGTVKTDNLKFDGNTISSTDTNGDIIFSPDGTGEISITGTTATIITAATDQALTISPNGSGAVNVPAGYKDRAGFGTNSLTSKEYVDTVIAGGTIASIPLRHGVTIGMMAATQANPVVITASDGSVRSITGATNASPVQITTSGAHGLVSGDRVFISNVTGMTDINDLDFYVKYVDATNFQLYSDIWLANPIDGTAYGVYSGPSGDVEKFINHNLENGAKIQITGVVGMTELNSNTYYANNVTATTFELYDDAGLLTSTDGSGFTAYTSGGSVAVQEVIENGDTLVITSGTNMNVGISNDKYTVNLASDVLGLDNLQTDVLELTTAGTPTIQTPAGSNANLAINPDGTGVVLIGGTAPTIATTDSNLDLVIDPHGTGKIDLKGEIIIDSSITTASGSNANITLAPNGTGKVLLSATEITTGTNEDIVLEPNGTGTIDFDGGITTATSATAGTNGDVPAQVVGYLIVKIAGTEYKIPYYNT